jgi:hypothetical protein
MAEPGVQAAPIPAELPSKGLTLPLVLWLVKQLARLSVVVCKIGEKFYGKRYRFRNADPSSVDGGANSCPELAEVQVA